MMPNESWSLKLFFYSVILIELTLPFSIRFNSYSIILFAGIWLLNIKNWEWRRDQQKKRSLLIYISYFLIFCVAHFYSNDRSQSLKELETKLPLFLLPLFFYSLPEFSENQIRIILRTFVAGCFLACTYCLAEVIGLKVFSPKGISSIRPYDFINENFTKAIQLHPVYLSAYLNFSLIILLLGVDRLVTNGRDQKKIAAMVVLIFFLLIFNLLASSRMGIFIMLIILTIFFARLAFQKKLRIVSLTSFGIMVSIPILLYFGNYTFKDRVDSLFSGKDTEGSVDQRMIIWQSGLSLYEKHWFFGVGTGDVRVELTEEYKLNNYTGKYFNTHNEYLQTGIAVGVFGILILLASFAIPFLGKGSSLLHFGFILIVAMSCLTESMLTVQKGVVFYSFFSALLTFGFKEKNLD